MKSILTFVFISLLLLNNLHAQSLVGKWECESITSHITKQNGTSTLAPNKIKEKGTSIIWEFLANGKFIAKQDKQVQEGTWQLKGNQLVIKGDFTKELAQSMGMDELRYQVEQQGNKSDFIVDATKMGPYK